MERQIEIPVLDDGLVNGARLGAHRREHRMVAGSELYPSDPVVGAEDSQRLPPTDSGVVGLDRGFESSSRPAARGAVDEKAAVADRNRPRVDERPVGRLRSEAAEDVFDLKRQLDNLVAQQGPLALGGRDRVADDLAELFEHSLFSCLSTACS